MFGDAGSARKFAVGAVVATLVWGLVSPTAALAAETPGGEAPGPDDAALQAAWDAWNAPEVTRPVTSTAAGARSAGARAALDPNRTYTSRLYRGSAMLWAEERVDFRTDGSRVTWSSGYQRAGALIPNTITRAGTKRIFTSRDQHQWRGEYQVGAGAPSPWGTLNLYSLSSTARTNVFKTSISVAWWVD
jgi:hypothetical protein